LSMDFEDCGLEVNVAVKDSDEEDNEVLLPKNWKGVTKEHYDQLYRHLHVENKDFNKRHCSNQRKIHGLEGKLKDLFACIQDLEAKIEELKALDDEGLRKFAKQRRCRP
jgi:predicted RNase H-like nuclease (RuvC/YqgF family)